VLNSAQENQLCRLQAKQKTNMLKLRLHIRQRQAVTTAGLQLLSKHPLLAVVWLSHGKNKILAR